MSASTSDNGRSSRQTAPAANYAAGALSGAKLRQLMQDGDPVKRLVVAPMLEPDEQLRDEQASLDVRLGCRFVFTRASAYGEIDEFSADNSRGGALDIRRLYQERYVPFGSSLVIHPHQFVLTATLEYLRLPKNLMAYVVGRSTWGRLGLTVATAIGVHPLFAGTLTLEIRNLGETPLRLYPGQSIAQLFFHHVDIASDKVHSTGSYIASVDMFPRTMSSSRTHEKLKKLIEQIQGTRTAKE